MHSFVDSLFPVTGGLWSKFDPEVCADFDRFLADPRPFWEMSYACDRLVSSARPNAAHAALASMEHELGLEMTIITQNIDGLHVAAGSSIVHELHGSFASASCLACPRMGDDTKLAIDEVRRLLCPTKGAAGAGDGIFAAAIGGSNGDGDGDGDGDSGGDSDGDSDGDGDRDAAITVPRCPTCGSAQLKMDCILFGEPLPEGLLDKALAAVARADTLLVVGSSLEVAPANRLPCVAKAAGARLVFCNLEATEMDGLAEVCLRVPAEVALPSLVAKMAG